MTSRKRVKYYLNNFNSISDRYNQAEKISEISNVKSINILSSDDKNNKIEFEYYEDYITLRKWCNSLLLKNIHLTVKIEEVFENIGVFIAKYHGMPPSSNADKYQLLEVNSKKHTQFNCFLHGDLTDNNILINDNYEVIIIDWEPTPIVNLFFNYGNALWDIVWFSNTLLRPSPGTFFKTRTRINFVKRFLEGYEKVHHIDLVSFFLYFDNNVSKLVTKIYKNKDPYHKLLYKKHLKNWKTLEKQLLPVG